jgi:hypothetical protein
MFEMKARLLTASLRQGLVHMNDKLFQSKFCCSEVGNQVVRGTCISLFIARLMMALLHATIINETCRLSLSIYTDRHIPLVLMRDVIGLHT